MRRSLGTTVFSGMLGVTLFGIFLTPVFFYVILELGVTRLFLAVAATGWLGSTMLGGVLGLAGGYLFAKLGSWRCRGRWSAGPAPASWRCWPCSAFIGKSARGRRQGDGRDCTLFHRSAHLRGRDLAGHRARGGRGRDRPCRSRNIPNVTPPAVLVTTVYPGANATTVRDIVAAPIEEQVSGVEGMLYMSSRCTNDGAYNLLVTFKPGTNSDMAQVLVQNRVSLALPVIPLLVQTEGISVKKTTPTTMMIVNLVSPDHRYDATFLSNYATIYLKDELGRVPGVADITYFGQRDYSMRAWLDPDKLAALNLTAGDVVTAIAQQNLQVAAGQIGQPPNPSRAQQFQLTINTLGRLTDPDQFADIIVKTAQGQSTTSTGANPSPSTAPPGATVAGTSGPMSQQTSAINLNGPTPPVTGMVRLRDVVRDDEYVMRLRFDPAKLARRGLRADAVVAALEPRPVSIKEDPDAKPEQRPDPDLVGDLHGNRAPVGLATGCRRDQGRLRAGRFTWAIW